MPEEATSEPSRLNEAADAAGGEVGHALVCVPYVSVAGVVARVEDRVAEHLVRLEGVLTAGCIDTGLPAGRRNFGQSVKTLIETANVHHAR